MKNRNSYLIDIRLVKGDEEGKCKLIGSYESDYIPYHRYGFRTPSGLDTLHKKAETHMKLTYNKIVNQIANEVSQWEP